MAYYIFKTGLLNNLDKFINYCDLHRNDPWKFQGDANKLWEIIYNSIQQPDFINTIDRLIPIYKNINSTNKFGLTSLRMTLHEFRS